MLIPLCQQSSTVSYHSAPQIDAEIRNREDRSNALVMIVVAPNDIDVQRDTSTLRERLEDMRNHLCRQISNLLSFEL